MPIDLGGDPWGNALNAAGEDAPSLQNLQISGAHLTLVIRSGIKGEIPSFAKDDALLVSQNTSPEVNHSAFGVL
jgi:hypothetical protein